jgi:hypothetical protein
MVIHQSRRRDARVTLIDGVSAVSRLFDLTGVRHTLAFESGT